MSSILLIVQIVILIVNIRISNGIPGGYNNVPKQDIKKLEADVKSGDWSRVSNVNQEYIELIKIEEASQQVVAGMNYQILAKVGKGCEKEVWCIKAFRGLGAPNLAICCVTSGSKSCEFQTCSC